MEVRGRKETNTLSAELTTVTKRSPLLSSTWMIVLVLSLAYLAAFCNRLFAVIRFESIIHEFDPWFNYRATAYMVEHGFYNFLNWFDERAWYPLGRIVGGTVYPGLMLTSGLIHYVLEQVSIRVHIRDICVFLAPIFSGLTAIATYFLTKELWSPGAGLFAAAFISIVPGYISRSVAGSYDNEGIAIFALQATYFLWIKALKSGSVFWAALTALSYFYMVSAWGGYVFIINLIPLHVFVLIAMGRYSHRVYVSYSTFYVLGLLLSMQIPFVGFQPIRTSEHMAATGVFLLVQAVSFFQFLQSRMSRSEIRMLSVAVTIAVSAVVYLIVWSLTLKGVIAPWSGRFYSLWDTSYAKIHIPIISSVSEHQPTTWFSFFFDLHVLICTFPVGLWYTIKNLNDERVLAVLYALSAVYFAGIMVRLMLTLTPIVCVLSGIAFSIYFDQYTKSVRPELKQLVRQKQGDSVAAAQQKSTAAAREEQYDRVLVTKNQKHRGSSGTSNSAAFNGNIDSAGDSSSSSPEILFNSAALILLCCITGLFAIHCTWVTSNAYSNPSVVLASYSNDGNRIILDDFREAYYWLSQNTDKDARIMSWWDYGYQIAGMANRTTLVDNNTWNNSHIALVGKAMSSNESVAYEIMTKLDVDYVLVIFGGLIGYSGDDINKFLWMVRIANGEYPNEIKESSYFTANGEYRVDEMASKTMLNCLMYKLSYYRFGKLQSNSRMPSGYDRTRNAVIGNKNFELTYLEEAFTSEHWLVRIYRVKKPHEFNRLVIDDERSDNSAKSLASGVGAVISKTNMSGGSSWALTARKRHRKFVSQKKIFENKKVPQINRSMSFHKSGDKDSGIAASVMSSSSSAAATKRLNLETATNFMKQYRDPTSRELKKLSANQFMEVWSHYDRDSNGYIEGGELDGFLREFVSSANIKDISPEEVSDEMLVELKTCFMDAYDDNHDGKIDIRELAQLLPMEENFLLLFRLDNPLESSVEFMKIWREYDTDGSGFIEADELKNFLRDLLKEAKKINDVSEDKLIEYTDTMGATRLTKEDIERVFALYDRDNNGTIENEELRGFLKDLLELVKKDYDAQDLCEFEETILRGIAYNNEQKVNKKELTMILLTLAKCGSQDES